MTNGRISFAVTDTGVGHILLNRADKLNAVDIPLAEDLGEAVRGCQSPDVRAVLLTASGKHFSAGGDIFELSAMTDAEVADWIAEITAIAHEAVVTLTNLPKPVVSAVQGNAVGGGMGIALAADLVLAAESATFTLGFSRVGLGMDSGTSHVLPRLVGLRKALDLALSSAPIGAQEAVKIGLITSVVPDEALADEALTRAEALAAGPTLSFAAAKELIRVSDQHDIGSQLDLERDSMIRLATSSDAREGMSAAAQRRTPVFTAN